MNNYKIEQVKCLICGYETNNHQSFNSHIAHAHHIKSKDYYDMFLKKEDEGICLTCGKPTKFNNMWDGYRTFCCNSCMSSNEMIQNQKKETSNKHFGVDYPHQSEIIKQNMEETNMRKFGAGNVFASEYGKEKIKETNMKKFGIDNPAKVKEVQEKIANTCMERYNASSPLGSELIQEKIKQTLIREHGVEYSSQIPESREKTKETVRKRHGVDFIFQLERVRARTAETAYTQEARSKAAKTRRLNGNRSKLEDFLEDFFIEHNIDYQTEYKESRYPYFCDFYLPDTDTFIEINGYWTHVGHWFDETNQEDLQLLEQWKQKDSPQYKRAIYVWTQSDIEKRNTANKNNLNYIVLWNKQDIINYINSFNI
jgi:hypothetical protein